ncbi:DTW domain-containing protein 1 [Geranomyces michiganensis]|nr:DTW domain-containing protein 1 [Geranomyces michiganensis]
MSAGEQQQQQQQQKLQKQASPPPQSDPQPQPPPAATTTTSTEPPTSSSSPSSSPSPWASFQIASTAAHTAVFQSPTARSVCPSCNKSRKLFCPACAISLPPAPLPPANVQLPLNVIIYRDPRETEGKTTSAHAGILAPKHVQIKVENIVTVNPGDVSSITQLANPEKILLLFPSAKSLPLSEVPNLHSYDRLIVLDGTWKQGRAMAGAIASLPFQHVRIAERQTMFWRYQPWGPTHLSTIEATYYFFRDYFAATATTTEYDGRYDNLLFYFKIQWETIQQFYRDNTHRTFTGRKLDGKEYIRY